MSYEMPNRPRCIHCCNTKCADHGKRIRREAPCKNYKPIPPELRETNLNIGSPRLREKRTIKISAENHEFLTDYVYKMDYKISNRATRAVNFCLDKVREKVDGGLITIPKRPQYLGRGQLNQFSQTFTTENWAWVKEIQEYYAENNDKRSVSWIVDYIIEMVRKATIGE